MIQQTIQIGNSVGVVIPKNILTEKNIKIGDKVQIEIKPLKKEVGGVDAKFMKMVDEFIEEHKDVLEQLAHR
jgi:putative addiction module antidote